MTNQSNHPTILEELMTSPVAITADDPIVTRPRADVELVKAKASFWRSLNAAVVFATILGAAVAIEALVRW